MSQRCSTCNHYLGACNCVKAFPIKRAKTGKTILSRFLTTENSVAPEPQTGNDRSTTAVLQRTRTGFDGRTVPASEPETSEIERLKYIYLIQGKDFGGKMNNNYFDNQSEIGGIKQWPKGTWFQRRLMKVRVAMQELEQQSIKQIKKGDSN